MLSSPNVVLFIQWSVYAVLNVKEYLNAFIIRILILAYH